MSRIRTLPRIGVLTRQPLVWLATTAVLAAAGARGRRAALRGAVCYLVGATVGNGLKPVFGRPQPRHRFKRRPQVVRGSFPSGHAAAEVAYTFGAAAELPAAFLPVGTMALMAHWSLTRAGKHYVSDTIWGGTIGLGVVALVARLWPARRRRSAEPGAG